MNKISSCTVVMVVFMVVGTLMASPSVVTDLKVKTDGYCGLKEAGNKKNPVIVDTANAIDKTLDVDNLAKKVSVAWCSFKTEGYDLKHLAAARLFLQVESVDAEGSVYIVNLESPLVDGSGDELPEKSIVTSNLVYDLASPYTSEYVITPDMVGKPIAIDITDVIKETDFHGIAIVAASDVSVKFCSREGEDTPRIQVAYDSFNPAGTIIAVNPIVAAVNPPSELLWQECDGSALSDFAADELKALLTHVPNLSDTFLSGGAGAAEETGGNNVTTLSEDNVPSHTHDIVDPGHAHGVTDSGHAHGVTDAGHGHGAWDSGHGHGGSTAPHSHDIYDNGHDHPASDTGHAHWIAMYQAGLSPNDPASVEQGSRENRYLTDPWERTTTGYASIAVYSSTTGIRVKQSDAGVYVGIGYAAISVSNNHTGVTVDSNASGVSVDDRTTGITVSNTGNGVSYDSRPQYYKVRYFMKIK